MHYGLGVPNVGAHLDALTLAQLARDAEAAGWEGFFLWDHVLPTAIVAAALPVVDPWIALSAIALRTSSIRIGPLVTPLPRSAAMAWRSAEHSSVSAMAAASVLKQVVIPGPAASWQLTWPFRWRSSWASGMR